MKKALALIVLLALLLCLPACGRRAVTATPEAPGPVVSPPVETAPATAEPAPENAVTVALYIPNDNADGFDVTEVSVPELTAQALMDALVAADVFSQGVAVNSFTLSGTVIALDMNAAFGQALQGTGTAGEYMLIGSLVDTFLDAFDAEGIDLTVDGGTLETGHSIYDQRLGWRD